MIRRLERDYLCADLATVEALLASAPPGDVLGRMSLEERRDAVRAELAVMKLGEAEADRSASTALFFGGAPVLGSRGIDADFASEALGKYQDLVTKVWAGQAHGALPATGPVRDRRDARLHITSLVHGSFGFELKELEGPLTIGYAPLHDAVEAATQAIVAAGESDDAFADAAERLDGRAFAALKEFFGVLRRAGASFRVVAGETDYKFEVRDVEIAADRSDSSRTEEQDVPVTGEFLAVLPEGRRFELRSDKGETIRGRVDDDLTSDDLRTMNTDWAVPGHVAATSCSGSSRSRVERVVDRF